MRCKVLWLCLLAGTGLQSAAEAQLVGIALEPKVDLVDGVQKPVQSPGPDMAVFLEFEGATIKKVGQVAVPTAIQGPPTSIGVAADKSFALVGASNRIDPEDPTKFAPSRILTVIDLTGTAPRAVQTLELGAPPASLAINPAGTMAIAVHSADHSVTVLAIKDRRATIAEKLAIGENSGPLEAAFSPDGRQVLLTRGGDNRVSLYAVADGRLTLPSLRDFGAGLRPFGVSWCGTTGLAVVSNFGIGNGDMDTVSLIDLGASSPRVVDTVTVGPVPEGLSCAPDGKHAAAAVQNMSNRPASNPFYSPNSRVVLLGIENRKLRRLADMPIGGWSQGVAFLDDSQTLFAETVLDRSLHVFRIEGENLKMAAPPYVFEEGAPMAIGVAGR